MKKITLLFSFLLFLGLGTSKAQYTILHNFNDTLGGVPDGSLTISGSELYGMTYTGGANGFGCVFSIDTNGSKYKDLFNFDSINGSHPMGSLTYSSGILYGMAYKGGKNNFGCVFSIDTNGTGYKDIWDFNDTGTHVGNSNGAMPNGSLTLLGNELYGMCGGGAYNIGIIFSIKTDGTAYKDRFDFKGSPHEGADPGQSLLISGDTMYGMTWFGGADNIGCIFSIDTNGSNYRNIFNTNFTNAGNFSGSLVISGNNLYGMSHGGGTFGTVFTIKTNGSGYKELLDFSTPKGLLPYGSLLQLGNTLYGMTRQGGANNEGNIFSIDTDGSAFNDMFDFNAASGNGPLYTTLISSGNVLYGLTYGGGQYNDGVIFRFKDTALHNTEVNSINSSLTQISIYPNPSNGIFTVICHSERSEESLPIINMYNMLGEQVLTETLRSAQGDNAIDLSNQPNGIYLYRVIANSGELMGEGKLIIQK